DRRKLVASVTRELAAEPAGVVRSILAALEGTRDLDTYTRCRAFSAVERAGFAIESRGRIDVDQVRRMLEPFEPMIVFAHMVGGHGVALCDGGGAAWGEPVRGAGGAVAGRRGAFQRAVTRRRRRRHAAR